MLFRGDFVHSPTLAKPFEILHDHLLSVNKDGFIDYVGPSTKGFSQQQLNEAIRIPNGSFLLPTFCDLHLHAPQFLYQGTGLHLPLVEWLNEYAFKAEERVDGDPALAHKLYTTLTQRLIENGTGAVLLFGTINVESNLILARALKAGGIRGFVGKLSMDQASRPSYIETTEEALRSLDAFINEMETAESQIEPSQRLVYPVITPRFVPTCSDALLSGLGERLSALPIRLQSHMAESLDQVEWVKSARGIDDIRVFQKHNLLSDQTIQAHCTFIEDPPDSIDVIASSGTAIAHCPLSNAYFSARQFPLRETLDRGIKVGLGTDIAGGYSADIMNAMRQAVITSRIREGQRQLSNESKDPVSIDWKESLYLATRGGAVALGLSEGSGSFAVGAPFDAQLIQVHNGAAIYANIDFIDPPPEKLTEQVVEKWWSLGDNQSRRRVWIQGRAIYTSPP